MSQETDQFILNNPLAISTERYTNTLVSLASLSIIKSSAGFLHALTVAAPSCATITFYNHASGPSGAILVTFSANIPMGSYLINTAFATGLVVGIPMGGVTPQLLINQR